MHICYLCNEYPPDRHGGVGSFTQTLAREMVKRGHQVSVLGIQLATGNRTEVDHGVYVNRLAATRIPKAGHLRNGALLRNALLELDARSPIHVIEGPELSLAALSNETRACKVIRMHGGHHFFSAMLGRRPTLWRSWLERRSFARADALCAVSKFVAETTRELLRLHTRAIEIIPNPVDTELFQPSAGAAEKPGLIVFVGTVCEKKGIRQLVQAMPQIIKSVPYARLYVAGRDWRDPKTGRSYIDEISSRISSELKSVIEFVGAVDHDSLPSLLSHAQVCVFPSHMEAQGIVALEAMAMGKLVVYSQTGPGREIVEDTVSGLLCNPFEPASIAEKVTQGLLSPALRRRVGTAARDRAVAMFSVRILAERNEAFYTRCLA